MADWTKLLAWLQVGAPDNPCPFEVLDCRAACAALARLQTDLDASEAIEVIEQVTESRPSALASGTSLIVPCSIKVPLPACEPVLAEHGHRWRIRISGQAITAHRRSTGQLVHVAEFETHKADIVIKRLISSKQFVYSSSDYAVAEMAFLIQTYLEAKHCPFPIPPGLGRKEMAKIALSGWKAHGIAAEFARFL
jgi:hypothetical protein